MTTPVEYDRIAADADVQLLRAQADAEACDARVSGAQAEVARSRARLAEVSAMRDFVARHPGLSADDLVSAAEDELREVNAGILQAQAGMLTAGAAVTAAAERLRDLQGYAKVARELGATPAALPRERDTGLQ